MRLDEVLRRHLNDNEHRALRQMYGDASDRQLATLMLQSPNWCHHMEPTLTCLLEEIAYGVQHVLARSCLE